MSLTNPNNVVTEERLNEYHKTILPYLGGMPDIMANKFNKSDLYSTDEKLIGRWIDGKPLYQKTIDGTLINGAMSIPTGVENIEKILKIYGIRIGGDTGPIPNDEPSEPDWGVGIWWTTDNNIHIRSLHYAGQKAYVTIQYTKTTDSPVEIGPDTDYSTTEKIVGTWIDGKPLYQKTVSTGGAVPSGATLIQRETQTGYDTIKYTKAS